MFIVVYQSDVEIIVPQLCLIDTGLMFKNDFLEEVICKLGLEEGIGIF